MFLSALLKKKHVVSASITGSILFAASLSAHDIEYPHKHVEGGYESEAGFVSDTDVTAELWNPREKSPAEVQQRADFLLRAYDLERTQEQQARAAKAKVKYGDAIAINSVMIGAAGVAGHRIEHFLKGLQRNHEAQMTAVSVTAYAYPSDGLTSVFQRLEESQPSIEANGFILIRGVEDIHRAKKEGKLAVVFNSQGADYAIDDLENLGRVKAKGLLISGFTYNNDSALAGGGSRQTSGVTELGRKWVEEMNRLNLVVDCSHASNQTCIDAAEISIEPIIASHSPAYALNNINRNISDEAMIAIGKGGGAVCTTGVGLFLNPEGDASPEAFAKHVDYTGDLIGRDKTCFSTDYMHNAKGMFDRDVANVTVFAPEKGFGRPAGNTAAEHIWAVVAVLEDEYGWSESEIRGFLGENLMRVYEANWKK